MTLNTKIDFSLSLYFVNLVCSGGDAEVMSAPVPQLGGDGLNIQL